MFAEGTFQWEAETLDGRTITREIAGVSAEQLDPKSLKWFRIASRDRHHLGRPVVEAGVDATQIEVSAGEVRVTHPGRYDRIAFIRRKRFPLDMSSQPREIYLLKLRSGEEETVVLVQPALVRVTAGEPLIQVR